MTLDALLDLAIAAAVPLLLAAGWRRRQFAPVPALERVALGVAAVAIALAVAAHPSQVAQGAGIVALVLATAGVALGICAALESAVATAPALLGRAARQLRLRRARAPQSVRSPARARARA
jgi:hypothetical protein